jgi:hypothetical protein
VTRQSTGGFLERMDLPPGDLWDLPSSKKSFPDGAQWRIEIPSTEGVRSLGAVLGEADRLSVDVHRVSQGSGVFMLSDRELDGFAELGATARVEVSLFARPNAEWGTGAMAYSPDGAVSASVAHGQDQVVHALEDIRRAAEHGIRSVLIADLGVLAAFDAMRRDGLLPHDMQAKTSVMLPVANPSTARIVASLGASTINVATDLSLAELAAIRASLDIPLDVYVESPAAVGGFVRFYEIPEIVRIAAPVYLKFGLRDAPDVYPAGTHLEDTVVKLSRERVRRARLGVELLERSGLAAVPSRPGVADLAIPESPGATVPLLVDESQVSP